MTEEKATKRHIASMTVIIHQVVREGRGRADDEVGKNAPLEGKKELQGGADVTVKYCGGFLCTVHSFGQKDI